MVRINKYDGMTHEQLLQSISTVNIGKDCRELNKSLRRVEKEIGIQFWERTRIAFEARHPKLVEGLFLAMFYISTIIFVTLKEAKVIDWSWIWIFSPFWILLVIEILLNIICDFLIKTPRR